tara:strand:- start:1071 stop:1568 length:498 start_codon:yes stop_codon:yes gene_type:complete
MNHDRPLPGSSLAQSPRRRIGTAAVALASVVGLFAMAVDPAISTASDYEASSSSQSGGQSLAALATLEKGQWRLRERNSNATRDICVTNPSALVQLRHSNAQCSHFVIENTASQATVHYTCPGHGHGRTTISVETPRLIQLQTQGVIDGAPFSSEFEGRRTGNCR